jgi:pilus assembly protein Flp/PilA
MSVSPTRSKSRRELTTQPRNAAMTNLVARFAKDESGATAIEYGLIAALIAVAIIGGARALGTSLNNRFTSLSGTVANP